MTLFSIKMNRFYQGTYLCININIGFNFVGHRGNK